MQRPSWAPGRPSRGHLGRQEARPEAVLGARRLVPEAVLGVRRPETLVLLTVRAKMQVLRRLQAGCTWRHGSSGPLSSKAAKPS